MQYCTHMCQLVKENLYDSVNLSTCLAGEIQYYMDLDEDTAFILNPTTGLLLTNRSLDREQQSVYHGTVYATDKASLPLTATALLLIMVTDQNDNDPILSKPIYYGAALETAVIGSTILKPKATDLDVHQNGHMTFTVLTPDLQDTFEVNSNTGYVSLKQELDREALESYSFVLKVTDGGTPSRYSTAQVIITVLDSNDNSPVFEEESYSFQVKQKNLIRNKTLSLLGNMRGGKVKQEKERLLVILYMFKDTS